ncbi:MAG: oligosaccharyl transferase glycoprotein complex, beta subunit [Chrysothrix sp. TS-e1954]|nr:MAG: oligosaccharyl transferase glycoprotein complex, beta subunit [Chrysothrix sp. TS-e1954]
MRSYLLTWLLLGVLSCVGALGSSGSRLLVVTDEPKEKDRYSKFFSDLEGRGFKITTESPKSDPALFKLGARTYDHLLILPSKLKALGPTLTPQILLDFVKDDGNILLALSSNTPTPSSLNSLLLELDIALPSDRDALVVDHFNFDSSSAGDKHDVLALPQPTTSRAGVKNYFGGDGFLAVPRAVGQTLGNASPLLASVLKAPATAYSYNPKTEAEGVEELFATGTQLSLVSVMQARNSARFTVLGSAEMLEDKWFDAKVQPEGGKPVKAANREFARQLSAWTFKELGVLRVTQLRHWLNEEPEPSASKNNSSIARPDINPKIYRIKNDVVSRTPMPIPASRKLKRDADHPTQTYTISLSEYTYTHWTPYAPPPSDAIQLEFTMLSPYHRLSLTPSPPLSDANSTAYTTSFRLPDQHGIFNFRVNYKRPFLTTVDEKDTVTVRHFAHDEWPRSYAIGGAWVWLLGIWVTVAGWVLFVGMWLWCEPGKSERGKVKKAQ